MELILRSETRELAKCQDKTSYNHVCYELKRPKFGITHIYEIYDDVSDSPNYELGVFDGDKFQCLIRGDGDSIPKGKENCGGAWVDIEIYKPELYFIE